MHPPRPRACSNKLLLFLSFFWGPMPVMIWVAIIIELAQAIITGEGESSKLAPALPSLTCPALHIS